MSVSPIPREKTLDTRVNAGNGIALPVARSLFAVDRWDVLLVAGVFMLVVGVGLVVGALIGVVVGIGSGLAVCGVLFMWGALHGAHNSAASNMSIGDGAE